MKQLLLFTAVMSQFLMRQWSDEREHSQILLPIGKELNLKVYALVLTQII